MLLGTGLIGMLGYARTKRSKTPALLVWKEQCV